MIALTLISLVLVIANGSQNKVYAKSTHNEESMIKDPITDLSRLRVFPRSGGINHMRDIVDQKLDVGASALHASKSPDDRFLGMSDSFSNLLSMSSIPAGKRRLDSDESQLALATRADIEALASSGHQMRKHDTPQNGFQNKRRGRTQRQQSFRNVQVGDSLMPESGFHEKYQQQTSADRNYNRRSLINSQAYLPSNQQEFKRRMSPGRLPVDDQPQQQIRRPRQRATGNPQEYGRDPRTRSRSGNKGVKSRSAEIDDSKDDIYDEKTNMVSSRRSDPIVDKGDDKDDDGDEDDDDGDENSSTAKPTFNRQRTEKLKAAPTRAKSTQRDDDADVDYADGDVDTADSRDILEKVNPDLTGGLRDLAEISFAGEDEAASQQLVHSSAELQTAAGHHHGHHGHYYQHVEVPKKKSWKFGFKRGNHKHEIERHEKGHKHKFHSEFKWHAKEKCKKKKKCKSVGKMTWEYKHDKKHHK